MGALGTCSPLPPKSLVSRGRGSQPGSLNQPINSNPVTSFQAWRWQCHVCCDLSPLSCHLPTSGCSGSRFSQSLAVLQRTTAAACPPGPAQPDCALTALPLASLYQDRAAGTLRSLDGDCPQPASADREPSAPLTSSPGTCVIFPGSGALSNLGLTEHCLQNAWKSKPTAKPCPQQGLTQTGLIPCKSKALTSAQK